MYTVKTYHNEIYYGVYASAPPVAAGQRVFDISPEGTLVQDDFDLYSFTGGQIVPTVLTFDDISVSDGQLDLKLVSSADTPNINALSIVRKGNVEPGGEEGDDTLAPYVGINLSNQNYVMSRSYQAPMSGFSPVNEGDVLEQVTYFDGLGRPMQNVLVAKASQDRKDIITHIEYDDYGRMEKEWLPYEGNTASGTYRSGAVNSTNSYYTPNYSLDLDGTPNPYSQKEFEGSPLNRVLKQAAPGKDWKLGNGHEVGFGYDINGSNEVRLFKVTFNGDNTEAPQLYGGNSYYATGELYKIVTKDENWTVTDGKNRTKEEFTDKQGRIILMRTFADIQYTNGTTDQQVPHDTYYVYDDFGNLTYVIPPKVTVDNISQSEIDELCYQYRYDYRNRLVEKKLPGKGTATDWESIIYNMLDRPIMTQDPNLKSEGKWLFTKYDAFGRVAYTGVVNNVANRSMVQNAADTYAKNETNKQWVGTGSTTLANVSIAYDNSGYPNTGITELHTINYYDGYDTTRDGIAKPTGLVQGQAVAGNVRGMPTVSKVGVLETTQWETILTAYDVKGRTIYIKSENPYLNTVEVFESELDFGGKVIKLVTSHQRGFSPAIVTVDRFDYDHATRKLKHRQELDGKTEVIAFNTYDGTGLLTKKNVGHNKAEALQTVDYRYNIRKWLKNINDVGTFGDDLFAFTLEYNNGIDAQYNGNISRSTWRTKNDNISKWYTYRYDPLDRLRNADFISSAFDYCVDAITYDKNGNIKLLLRNGPLDEQGNEYGSIDILNYAYNEGNKLEKVIDVSYNNEGFKDGANAGNDYLYDQNGNMTSDANKGITSVEYNHLNMPSKITVMGTNAGVLDYTYSADGTKLRKVKTQGSAVDTTDYIGGFVYENGTLKQITQPEVDL